MSFLQIRDVSVRFGPYLALDGVSLDVARGEVVTLIGHSGCGKSTLLNLVAGLNRPTSGTLLCGGLPLTGPGPDRGVVFQNHSLLPWMTCLDNVLLGVDRVFRHSLDKAGRRAKAEAALRLVHLDHVFGRSPGCKRFLKEFGDRCDCGRVSGLLARHIAAGPDGFRARCPNAMAALAGRVVSLGTPDVGSTDRHLPSLPSCTWHQRVG